MEEPKGWLSMSNEGLLENQKTFQHTEEELAKLLESEKSGIFLAAYYKYDPKKHAGLIPAIQIYVKAYTPRGFQQFKKEVTEGSKGLKEFYKEFEFVQEPTETEVSGIQSMYFICKYTSVGTNGVNLKGKSRAYMIPYKNYFFQIGFNDGQTEEDNAELFDKLVKTIKIGK